MLALLTLAAALSASPSPAASPSAAPAPTSSAPAENPAITKLANEQFDDFAAGKVNVSEYSVKIPKDALAQVQAGLSSAGAVKSVTLVKQMDVMGSTVYVYRFTCANAAVLEQLSLKDGKINGIYFAPAQ